MKRGIFNLFVLLLLSLHVFANDSASTVLDSFPIEKDEVLGEFLEYDSTEADSFDFNCPYRGCEQYGYCSAKGSFKLPGWLIITLTLSIAVAFLIWNRKNLNYKIVLIVAALVLFGTYSGVNSILLKPEFQLADTCVSKIEQQLAVVDEGSNLIDDTDSKTIEDEFKDFSASDATATDDEFGEFEEFSETKEPTTDDEFSDFEDLSNDSSSDEFEKFDEFNEESEFKDFSEEESASNDELTDLEKKKLYKTLGILAFTMLAGLAFRFRPTRKLKMVFLIISVVYLGFISGACPCMISSFQNLILLGLGESISWVTIIWFLGLIPVTYIFGKVWCGWVCHLGGLQEFLFRNKKPTLLQSEKSQKVLRWLRVGALVILIVQLAITKTNLYIKIDPFMVAYNLFSANTTGYVLLVLMILSSIFIYRPFCRTLCPVGLMLGWISYIPGASVIGVNDKCVSCAVCNNSCEYRAITRKGKNSTLKNQECIACGECLDACKKGGLELKRNNKIHHEKVQL